MIEHSEYIVPLSAAPTARQERREGATATAAETTWTVADCDALWDRDLYGVRPATLWIRRIDLAKAKDFLWTGGTRGTWDGGDAAVQAGGERLAWARWLFLRGRIGL